MRLLIVFALLTIGTTFAFQNRYYIDVLLENMPKQSKIYTGQPDMYFFDQKKDHFDANNAETFKQQYFVDDQFWGGPGTDGPGYPVFLYMGGEGDETERTFEFSWCAEYAQQFQALCISLEHR